MRVRLRRAFTMIELIFVIVIMAVLAKFGVEFLAQSYNNFINSKINNELQTNSATAVEFVAKRLESRIKASTIAREDDASFTPLRDYSNTTANIIEWVGFDVEGFRGDKTPYWSGIIDLNDTTQNIVVSPETNTTQIDGLIRVLSNNNSSIDDAAIYFVDPDSLDSNWGWDANGSRFDTQVGVVGGENAIHPIRANGTLNQFVPVNAAGVDNNFSGVEAFEFYQLAWSAYAVGIADWNATSNSGTLTLWYDYQPWKGERYSVDAKSSTIMENVSSFRFIARDSLVKIQVCVKSLLTSEEYSICKEKTIF